MRTRAPLLLLALTLIATATVYGPLISSYFVGDDFLNLFAIVDADLSKYLLRPHGGHLLMARNAIFVAFHAFFGMEAEPYFWAMLLTHLLNTFLLFRVIENWSGSAPVAALGTFLWAMCPIHARTLAWYSVYGQVLVGTILLLILYQASAAERVGRWPSYAVVVAWPLLFILASVCFGIGIGLTLVSPVALYLLLPPSRLRLALCLFLAIIALLTPTAYKAIILYHDQMVGTRGGWASAIDWLRAPVMFGYLLSAGASNLLVGFAAPLAGFPSVTTTLATLVFAVVIVVAFVRASKRERLRLLGLFVFAAGCYGVIAAGRATVLPVPHVAMSAAVPRYHYVGMLPLAILSSCALGRLTAGRYGTRVQYGLLLIAVALAIIFHTMGPAFIDPHLAARKETMEVVDQIRTEIEKAPPGSEARIENRPLSSGGLPLRDFRSGFPGWAGIFVLFFPDNVVDGKRVRFVVHDESLVSTIYKGKRSHDLFVFVPTPAPKPAGGRRLPTS